MSVGMHMQLCAIGWIGGCVHVRKCMRVCVHVHACVHAHGESLKELSSLLPSYHIERCHTLILTFFFFANWDGRVS